MKLNEWVNNYIKEVTHSHEYEDMSQMGEDENDPQEISVGNYQTKYFHVCPGASKLYGDIESKGVDMDMAERSVRLQDALYFVEEHIQRDGYKPERDYVMVAKNIAKNIMKMAEMMGLEKEHDYIQGHVDTIEKVVKEKGLEERVMKLTEENVPTDPSKWSYYKSQAKEKFDVYPSAYANAWAAKQYKKAGGGWKSESVTEELRPDEVEFVANKLGNSMPNHTNYDFDKGPDAKQVLNALKKYHKDFFRHSTNKQKQEIVKLVQKITTESVNEGYVKSMGYNAVTDKIDSLTKSLDPNGILCKNISKKADNVKSEFKQMKKHIDSIEQIWGEVDYVIEMSKMSNESVNEANDTYFKAAYEAAQYAREMAEKKGYEIDEDDWQSQIGFGGKYNRLRPGVGKTHSFSVGLTKNGKPQRKALNISLYGMDSGKFELTSYIN